MYEGGVTLVLEKLLVTLGDISRPAGTGELGIKAGERSNALHPELRQRGDAADLKCVWTNPAMTKRTGKRARLAIVGAE